jgi:hypothetical protein
MPTTRTATSLDTDGDMFHGVGWGCPVSVLVFACLGRGERTHQIGIFAARLL